MNKEYVSHDKYIELCFCFSNYYYYSSSFETLAKSLIGDRARLDALRAKLVAARASAPLFDIALYARRFERALLLAMTALEEAQPPRHIDVAEILASTPNKDEL